MEMNKPVCCFCGGSRFYLKYKEQPHPVVKQIGLFDMYECCECRSLITLPIPCNNKIRILYESFQHGMQEQVQRFRQESPLDAVYRQSLKRALKYWGRLVNHDTKFTWVDVGAGNGVLSELLLSQFPNSTGVAIDFHGRPVHLEKYQSLEWVKIDLNRSNVGSALKGRQFDLVISLAVLEHVQDPYEFVKVLISLIAKKGLLYMACPANDSLASRVMQKKWPYLIPGEHLNIPTRKGMHLLMKRALHHHCSSNMEGVFVKSVLVPYPLRYFLNYYNLNILAKLTPPSFLFKMPSGALESGVVKSE